MQSRAPVWLVLVKQLWFQVMIGAALGWLDPALRAQTKPFADGFIALKGAAGVAGAAFCRVGSDAEFDARDPALQYRAGPRHP